MAKIVKTITGLKPDQDYLVALKVKNTEISAIDDPYESIRIHTPRDQSIPGAIDTNTFNIYGNYKSVMFDFQPTLELDVNGYKYELYSDALGTALISSGTATATVFAIDVPDNSSAASADAAPTDVIYYGRIKSIDTSGNESGWTPSSGLKASTATDLISGSHIASLTAAKITAGTIGAHTITMNGINSILKSSNYQPATSNTGGTGWKISGDGKAVFNEASIRSSLDIGEDLGTSDATSFHVDATGNMWSGANSTSYATAPFKVTNTGDVTAKSLALIGSTVMSTDSKIYFGAGNYNNTNTPFYVDANSKFSLGDRLTWDGTTSTLSIRGSLKLADGSNVINEEDVQTIVDEFGNEIQNGFIGGLTINSSQMYYGAGSFGSSNTAFYVAENASTGQADFSLGDKLTWNGNTLAISGEVTANSGRIAGMLLESQKISKDWSWTGAGDDSSASGLEIDVEYGVAKFAKVSSPRVGLESEGGAYLTFGNQIRVVIADATTNPTGVLTVRNIRYSPGDEPTTQNSQIKPGDIWLS